MLQRHNQESLSLSMCQYQSRSKMEK